MNRLYVVATLALFSAALQAPLAFAQDGRPRVEQARKEEARKTENSQRDQRRAAEVAKAEKAAGDRYYQTQRNNPTNTADLKRALEKSDPGNSAGQSLAKSGTTHSPDGHSPTVPNAKPTSQSGAPSRGITPGK